MKMTKKNSTVMQNFDARYVHHIFDNCIITAYVLQKQNNNTL